MGYYANLVFPFRARRRKFQERRLMTDNDEGAIKEAKALVKKLNSKKREEGRALRYVLSSVSFHRIVEDFCASWVDEDTQKEME